MSESYVKLPSLTSQKDNRSITMASLKNEITTDLNTLDNFRMSRYQNMTNNDNQSSGSNLLKSSQSKKIKFLTPTISRKSISLTKAIIPKNVKLINTNKQKPVVIFPSEESKSNRKRSDSSGKGNFTVRNQIFPIFSPNIKKIGPTKQYMNFFKTNEGGFDDDEEDRKYNQMLKENIEKDYSYGEGAAYTKSIEIEHSPAFVGGFHEKNFYTYYREIDKILEQKDINQKMPPGIAIIKKMKETNSPPLKFGFFKERNKKSELNIAHYSIGDRLMPVIAEGIKQENFSSIGLSDNGISHVGANTFLSSISLDVRELDLSMNKIGSMGAILLCKQFLNPRFRLQKLSLESNKLGDKAVIQLAKSLQDNVYLTRLNLSNNDISEISCLEIAKLLEENYYIRELYFHYNRIKGAGGYVMFNALKKNKNLCVLDLSWNSLGSNSENNFAQSLSECLSLNYSIVHLDLSYNNINKTETAIIAKGLEANKTIYGLHFDGNQGRIDNRGFLIPNIKLFDNIACLNQSIVPIHRIDGVRCKREFSRRKFDQQKVSTCWICDGWNEVTFYWFPGKSGGAFTGKIFLHLSYDNFKPHQMNFNDNKFYELKEICPPLPVKYFFTLDRIPHAAKDQPHKSQKPIKINNLAFGNTTVDLEVHTVNILDSPINTDIFDQEYFTPNIMIQPRYTDIETDTSKPDLSKHSTWSYVTSIFKDYRMDTNELLMKCFEFDWQNTKIPKIIKSLDELLEVKEIIRGVYKNLKDTYKYYASIGVVGEVWSIPLNDFKNFIMSTGVVDQKTLKLNDIDFNFIAVNASDVKGNTNPERALIRFQFLEILIRLAEDKYLKTSICNNFVEAVKKLLEEHINPIIKNFDHQKWRVEKYWTESCDRVFNAYLPIIREVYRCYSGAKSKPGQKKYVSLDELRKLCSDCQLLDENFVGRDVNLAYNLSMMTQIDELNYERHLQMSFVEFLECLARIADKLLFTSKTKGDLTENGPKHNHILPLHVKIEKFMRILYEKGCSGDFKGVFNFSEDSLYDN